MRPIEINLLPQASRFQQALWRRKKRAQKLAYFSVGIFILMLTFSLGVVFWQGWQISRWQKQGAFFRQKTQGLAEVAYRQWWLKQKLAFLDQLLGRRKEGADFYLIFKDLLPAGAVIRSLRFQPTSLRAEVSLPNLATLNQLEERFNHSPARDKLAKIEISQPTWKGNGWVFSIYLVSK